MTLPTTRGQLPERDTFSWTVLSALAGEVDTGSNEDREVWIRLRKRRDAVRQRVTLVPSGAAPRRGVERDPERACPTTRRGRGGRGPASRRGSRRRGVGRGTPTPRQASRLSVDRERTRALFIELQGAEEGDPDAPARPGRPRRGAPAARRAPGPPVPQPRRALRRPRPGRHDRPDQVGRPVRPRAAASSSRPTRRRRSSARSSGTSATRAGPSGCPRRLQELRLSLASATSELSQKQGRAPTVHELAPHLKISDEEVLEGLESANAYSTLSLDAGDSGSDDEPMPVSETLGVEDEALEGVEYRESLKPMLEQLAAAREDDPAAAVLQEHDAVGDRGRDRHLADARLAAARPHPRPAARRPARRRVRRTGLGQRCSSGSLSSRAGVHRDENRSTTTAAAAAISGTPSIPAAALQQPDRHRHQDQVGDQRRRPRPAAGLQQAARDQQPARPPASSARPALTSARVTSAAVATASSTT